RPALARPAEPGPRPQPARARARGHRAHARAGDRPPRDRPARAHQPRLARAARLDLPPLDPPADPPAPEWHHRYDEILGALLATTPRISDPLAAGWTKGVARVVRYLKETDRLGGWAVEAEREDLVALLGAAPEDLHAGRRALAERNQRGEISDEEYVAYRWRAVQREAHLARTASGALHHRTWPPLT